MCRTILTTNFDPLLQRALQLVNVPYFVSDRPDTLQYLDDDIGDTLHLVHAHGSINRYLLLNSEEEISSHAARNRSLLQPYLAKHSIVIVGYSGWDDAIMQALSLVEQFQGNVYWCDRGKTLEESSLSPSARKFIENCSDAFYVPIEGANQFIAEMHLKVVESAFPQLFRNPMGYLQDRVDQCQMEGLSLEVQGDRLDLAAEADKVKRNLIDAEAYLIKNKDKAVRAKRALEQANDLYFQKRYVDSIPLFDEALQVADQFSPLEQSLAFFRRGVAYGKRAGNGSQEHEIQDYTRVIEMDGVPIDLLTKAILNRGIVCGRRSGDGDQERAIQDSTQVIEMEGVPIDLVARALVVRGVASVRRAGNGDQERAIQDYTQVIRMEGAPIDLVEMARNNLQILRKQQGKAQKT